ncbi:dynamin family protein [Dactylosporangium sp. NPDC049525]|uniref:dynamin family protein n=1 Tax=Dactylosporangium sp. NPDC049525 TaxID=3154730 RepID=UPI00342B58E1
MKDRVRSLLDSAVEVYRGRPAEERLRDVAARLDEPLRVAVAGRVKAGKSTLLNALVGERLAATDATECTRVLTWYSDGVATRVWAYPTGGEPRQLRFHRDGDATVIDLGDLRAEDLSRLTIEVPNARLRRLTLIDTPGIASMSRQLSARTTAFLTDDDGAADAVLYLIRHLHLTDMDLLEAFHDQRFAGSTPVNAIGVLARADEIGAGRGDALQLAERIADGFRADARVRGLVQAVIPVAGLLGQAGSVLGERHFAQLRDIPAEALRSADRFAADDDRRELLDLLGLFGVRLAVALLRQGVVRDAGELARDLRRRSGLDELRRALAEQFTERAGTLKAHAALRTLEVQLSADPVPAAGRLHRALDGLLAGAHELAELRLLNDLRTGAVELADTGLRDEAETLLGAAGTAVPARLGLPADAPPEEVRAGLLTALGRWQRAGESPVAGAAERRVAAVLRRTCEGLLG